MRPRRVVAVITALLGVAGACSSDAPTSSSAASASSSSTAPSLDIVVEIDGKDATRIDRAAIDAHPPDRTDTDRKIWRLRTLVGELYPGRTAAVSLETSAGRKPLTEPEGDEAREAMVAMNGAGELRIALARADEPFPAFEDARAIGGVTRVVIASHGLASSSRAPATAASLRVELAIGDDPARPVTEADLEKVPRLPYANDEAESRDAWSLREVVRALAGPTARLIAVEGEGRKVDVDAARWNDASVLPVLRVTRRGLVKFQWLTPKMEHLKELADLRGVTRLRVTR